MARGPFSGGPRYGGPRGGRPKTGMPPASDGATGMLPPRKKGVAIAPGASEGRRYLERNYRVSRKPKNIGRSGYKPY